MSTGIYPLTGSNGMSFAILAEHLPSCSNVDHSLSKSMLSVRHQVFYL